jgi:small-conductance mechanosensitive channel
MIDELMNAWDQIIKVLDKAGFTFGATHLSLLLAVKAVVVVGILLWVARFMARVAGNRIAKIRYLSPSIQTLITTLIRAVLLVLAVLLGLNLVGIDLTTLTVLTGGIGVGIGLGLQKIVANFLSGIVLLIEHSIKPGDVIETGDSYGRVTHLGGRYTSVLSRDGKNFLIPNETLITNKVVNWSYRSRQVRLAVPFSVAYGTDLRLTRELAIDAADATNRVLHYPSPVCHVTGFGDSGVNLSLRFWIEDPENGVTNVKSSVCLGLWDRLQEHQIAVPYNRDYYDPTQT